MPHFQALFCERFKCPVSQFEEKVFRKCLYWHARPFAPVLRLLMPKLFAEDFKFIRYLGASTGLREAVVDLMNFRDTNLGRAGFWRGELKLRVSGRKASKLAQELFRTSGQGGGKSIEART